MMGVHVPTAACGVDGAAADRKAVRILHVEDSKDDAALVLRELRRSPYEVHVLRVETPEEMQAALTRQAWDLVISDHSLPRFSAPEAFAMVQKAGLDVPFIIVSGTLGEEVAVEAMRSGVHDYILKGNLRRLSAAVERELREAEARAEQRNTRHQLMIAERMASVGTLAAGVAHEINNPLAVVIGNVHILMDQLAAMIQGAKLTAGGRRYLLADDLAEQVREPLADVREAADRVRVIVRDLRVFSRADEETHGPIDVRKVLDSSVRMARNELRHRAEVIRRYEDVHPVDGNEARLGQVFLNLIVNAAQAIPEGKVGSNTITLSTRAEGSRVIVEVADTGAGIPADVLPRIFDIFFTTKPVGVGTGLGLSICHRIVTGMNGEIAVDSRVGAGTTFRVTLPCALTSDAPEIPLAPNLELTPGRRAKVLIVDDEEPVGRLFQRILQPRHDAEFVSKAREVLTRLDRGERIDLILCDLMMPDMTGMDLHAALMERGDDLARRMVFVTGGAYTPASREFLDGIPNHTIEKPVDIGRLAHIVDEICTS